MSFCTGIGNRVRRLRRLTIVYRDRRALAEDIILFRIASTVSCVAITFAVWPAANDAMTAFFGVQLPNAILTVSTLGVMFYYSTLTGFLWKPAN